MTIGRPPKYETAEEMQRIIDLYFLACKVNMDIALDREGKVDRTTGLSDEDLLIINDIEDANPIVSGLAYTLGMTTECLRNYGTQEEFSATVKTAKQRVEMNLERRLAGTAVTGSIFSLKNNFGWKDKTEQEMSGSLQISDMTNDAMDRRIEELEALKDESS